MAKVEVRHDWKLRKTVHMVLGILGGNMCVRKADF